MIQRPRSHAPPVHIRDHDEKNESFSQHPRACGQVPRPGLEQGTDGPEAPFRGVFAQGADLRASQNRETGQALRRPSGLVCAGPSPGRGQGVLSGRSPPLLDRPLVAWWIELDHVHLRNGPPLQLRTWGIVLGHPRWPNATGLAWRWVMQRGHRARSLRPTAAQVGEEPAARRPRFGAGGPRLPHRGTRRGSAHAVSGSPPPP